MDLRREVNMKVLTNAKDAIATKVNYEVKKAEGKVVSCRRCSSTYKLESRKDVKLVLSTPNNRHYYMLNKINDMVNLEVISECPVCGNAHIFHSEEVSIKLVIDVLSELGFTRSNMGTRINEINIKSAKSRGEKLIIDLEEQ